MAQWTIDPAHSEIKFKVKHLVISTVTGRFDRFSATIQANRPDFSDARIQFEADVNSISTNNEQRDGHLKSPDFFDAESYPEIKFASTSITRKEEGEYALAGNMTIRGTSRPVSLKVVYNGTVKGFDGDVAAFEITGTLNRQEFGLRWNAMTETGGVVVSDDVKLDIVAELKKVEVEVPVSA
jgi:polyisoprenoid-binding protein YceI